MKTVMAPYGLGPMAGSAAFRTVRFRISGLKMVLRIAVFVRSCSIVAEVCGLLPMAV